jgi:DNA-binding cell septation regulator SpoVG
MSETVFTNLQVTPLKRDAGNTKASGMVTVADVLTVRFTVSDGKNGLWVKLPQHTFQAENRETGQKETKFVKDVRIIDEGLYKEFTDLVINEYKAKLDNPEAQSRPAGDKKPF